ncbi:MAG: putative Mitotic checkpoint protein BUB3.1, partial [Streblomastix strix]
DRRSETRKNVWSVDMKDKVYCMDVRGNACVVGLADGRVLGYDLRNMGTFLYSSVSPLKYQTRCIRIFPNCEGFALAGIEGRVAMEYFGQDDEQQSKKYTFKCHREQRGGVDYVYTINTVEFHPIYGTFASGGCDGVVNIWDGEKRKRLTQFPKYETSISSLSFNGDGTLLAVAASYTWESGDEDHPADSIYVRTISDSDLIIPILLNLAIIFGQNLPSSFQEPLTTRTPLSIHPLHIDSDFPPTQRSANAPCLGYVSKNNVGANPKTVEAVLNRTTCADGFDITLLDAIHYESVLVN